MASLGFFGEPPAREVAPSRWGTGFHYEGGGVSRAPTWHATGKPIDHPYKLTELTLSKARDNDELVPRPEAVDITKSCINQPFPAEHPFASHIEKFSLFPTFDSPQDPKRGVYARQKPISGEMPANPYPTRVTKKAKGFPYREEIVTIPTEGNREALYWPGEDYFDQQSKIHGNQQQFYPIPPKKIAPNLQERPDELCISENSANVLRNIERNKWITTHKLDYSVAGPTTPMVLDNLDNKKSTFIETGEWDNTLYPHFTNTFEPAHSLEGRLMKLFAPKSAQQIMLDRQILGQSDQNRKMTATEVEEHRLLNGKEYTNLPEICNDPLQKMKCQNINDNTNSEPKKDLQSCKKAEDNGHSRSGIITAVGHIKQGYPEEMREKRYKDVQGMAAQNRWQLLESSKPSHDIIQLREKYKILNRKEMPNTFYDHEGRYIEERAGLYKTSYNPEHLAYSMNAQQLSGGALFNTSMSHFDARLYPTIIWDENEAALKGSQTVVFKNNELSGDRPDTYDVLLPYKEHVTIQRHMLQPTVETARPSVQEGKFVLRESTYGDSYNTKMFLQENKLHRNIRLEPRDLMSHENQNLERARESSVPIETPTKPGILRSVHFSDEVNVRNINENLPVRIGESHIQNLSLAEKEELARAFSQVKESSPSHIKAHLERPQSSGFAVIGDKRNLAENLLKPPAVPTLVDRNKGMPVPPQFVSFTREPHLRPPPISETADKFSNLALKFTPVAIKHQSGQFPSQPTVIDQGQKNDLRVRWEPGTGQPQPQSCLLDLQNSFVKSEVHKQFHRRFPETNPDIRSNFTAGDNSKPVEKVLFPELSFGLPYQRRQTPEQIQC